MLHFDLTRNLPQHRFRFRARLPQGAVTTALCGANGSGKSLLLSMLAGIEKPDEGRIAFGQDIFFDSRCNLPPERRRIGYAFQEARLFPHMSVEKNLDYAQRMRNIPLAKHDRDAVIDAFALARLLARYPQRLSGGEQQRVALARTLLSAPRLLLLDEPLSSLDRRYRRQALAFLHRWLREKNLPCLYVSHEMEELACIATHALVVASEQRHKAGDKAGEKAGDKIVRSRIATSSAIELATTEIATSQRTGASPVAVVPVVVHEQRALDGLWTVTFPHNPDARFMLSTHRGAQPAFLCTRERTTHARIRAEDVLLAERDDPLSMSVRLLALRSSRDGEHTAQIACSSSNDQQRLLLQLSAEQADRLQKTAAKTCHVRIRKAQGGIL